MIRKDIFRIRTRLKKDRKKFWDENRKNFEKNAEEMVKDLRKGIVPGKWKIYIVSGFLSGKKKYGKNTFSSSNLISATKQQGFEFMLFLNRAVLEFLSKPALVPLIFHELWHMKQVSGDARTFLLSMLNDKLSKKIEEEAEREAKKLNDEFRKEEVLESILYFFDESGWKEADKTAKYLHKGMKQAYGGGYEESMTEKEYRAFLASKKARDINKFIGAFS